MSEEVNRKLQISTPRLTVSATMHTVTNDSQTTLSFPELILVNAAVKLAKKLK